ncbi:MAG: ABC transporter ATP-binding protein [Longimicrobiales bacterium]
MSNPLLRATDLERRYGGRPILNRVSLDVERNQVLAILGPNGAGKSTLFRILLLLEQADAGSIVFDGRPVRAGDATARARMAGVFQRPWLFRGTVHANVAYGLRARTRPASEARAAITDVIDALGLAVLADAPVDTLSGGEAQRVALARALVLQPDLLLLDEPSANLDVTAQRRFREDLEHVVRTHARAAIIVTHDPAEAFALADRVAVLENGALTQVGSPAELVSTPATPFIAAFTGAELLLDGVCIASDAQDLTEVRLAGGAVLRAASTAGRARPAPGAAVHIAYRPEDVTIGLADAVLTTSASNRLAVVVRSVVPTGGLVRIRLEGAAPLTALLTRQSVESLHLVPGAAATAYLKAAALRVFPA